MELLAAATPAASAPANLVTNPSLAVMILVSFLLKLIGAIALWIVGTALIRLALRVLRRSFAMGKFDLTLIGIQTASFAALLAGAGVAIGAAWSGMLGNFATGVTGTVGARWRRSAWLSPPCWLPTTCATSCRTANSSATRSSTTRPIPSGAWSWRRSSTAAPMWAGPSPCSRTRSGRYRINTPARRPTWSFSPSTSAAPRLAVRPYTHTNHYGQVYFDTNRVIADTLSAVGFPVPRIPVQMAQAGAN